MPRSDNIRSCGGHKTLRPQPPSSLSSILHSCEAPPPHEGALMLPWFRHSVNLAHSQPCNIQKRVPQYSVLVQCGTHGLGQRSLACWLGGTATIDTGHSSKNCKTRWPHGPSIKRRSLFSVSGSKTSSKIASAALCCLPDSSD
jgi:hypothetical protein